MTLPKLEPGGLGPDLQDGAGGRAGTRLGLLPYATLAYFLLSLELTGGPEKSFKGKKKKKEAGGP